LEAVVWEEANMGQNKPTLYEKLGAMDAKCGALLQLTSLLLVFVSLSSVQEKLLSTNQKSYKALVIGLLLSCLLQLYVLWFKEEPSEKFVDRRKWVFNIAVVLTAAACLFVSVFTFYALLW
jgi:hypothetical protein